MTEQHALSPSKQLTPASELRPRKLDDSLDVSLNDTLELPDDFQPLDYEIMEYVGALPAEVLERLACELQARESLVDHLRSSNDRLARNAVASAARSYKRSRRTGPAAASSAGAEAASAAQVVALQAEAEGEASRSARAMARAQKLHLEILQVEEATDAELSRIALRVEAAEQRLGHQPSSAGLETEEVDDDRARLREAQHTIHGLHEHSAQLAQTRQQAERRAQLREQELRLICGDREQVREEIHSYRKQTAAFERSERQEEELCRELKAAKAELRRLSKAASTASQESLVPMTPKLNSQGRRPATPQSRPETPQKRELGERVQRALPIGGDASPRTPLHQASPLVRKASPRRVCASRATSSSRSHLMSIPTPLRALASMVR